MFKILMRLLSKKELTAKEIAETYDVSVRTAYRYLDELSVCGVPIEFKRGRYGGVVIADTYRLPAGYFSREEYAATINALDAMYSQIGDENTLSAREKFENRYKDERTDTAINGNIIIDGGTWGDTKKFFDKIKVVEEAISGCKSIKIDYLSREGEHSKRVIDPYVLILKQNIWYVYAYCHTKQDFRTFKIGRIKQASFSGNTFKREEISREDIPLDFYYPAEKLTLVTLEIEKESLADAEEWLGIENIEPRGKKFIAEMNLPDDDQLVGKILSYCGAVKVLEPQELKERVLSAAKKLCGENR